MPHLSLRAPFAVILAITLIGCNTAPSPSPIPDNRSAISGTQPRAARDTNAFDSTPNQSRRSHSRGSHTATDAQPGDFDFYLLNLSWSPEFCATHSGSPECSAHPGFVVHGLWPQNTDGTYPEHCSDAPGPSNPSSLTNLIPTESLVEHEWTTHGTCSGLPADRYFAAVRTAFQEVRIPAGFTSGQSPTMLSPDAILTQFSVANPSYPAGSFALSCGNNYLTAVEVCFDKSFHPEACQGVRSCRANAVKITPRNSTQ
jgi:ribonuclease T2